MIAKSKNEEKEKKICTEENGEGDVNEDIPRVMNNDLCAPSRKFLRVKFANLKVISS